MHGGGAILVFADVFGRQNRSSGRRLEAHFQDRLAEWDAGCGHGADGPLRGPDGEYSFDTCHTEACCRRQTRLVLLANQGLSLALKPCVSMAARREWQGCLSIPNPLRKRWS